MLAFVACAFGVAPLNPLLPPNPPLDGRIANIMLVVSESGNKYSVGAFCALMLLIILGRPRVARSQRLVELFTLPLAVLLSVGAGSMVNEKLLKPHFAVPRPNIVALAVTPPTLPFLRMPAGEFYSRFSPAQRGEYLAHVLETLPPRGVPMSASIRHHWIQTVGYSFPSGHAFSTAATATFFFLFGIRYLSGWRLGLCCLTLPWAVLTAYSRTILRVHTPTDILAGAILGVAISALVYLVWRAFVYLLAPTPQTRL
jgi:membrane-associated phospholipid phosphatase